MRGLSVKNDSFAEYVKKTIKTYMKNNPLITTRLQKKTYILSIDFANVWVELFCKRVGWK